MANASVVWKLYRVKATFMEDRGKEGARRITEITVKMCTHRRRSNR